MGDDTPQNVMNLDLNLGPIAHPSHENEPRGLNLEDWLDGPVREVINHRTIARQRWRSIWGPVLFPMETSNMALELITGSGPSGSETGEGSGRPPAKAACDNTNRYPENTTPDEKEDAAKTNENEGGFFDCNICLDMASDPVVTCCGHLFCWPCLYRWLHIHEKECPICKGEMSMKSVTPIYGRGNPTRIPEEEDSGLKIPHRPQAKRVESWRQTISRNAFTMPMEEMIRRLGSRFDLTRDLVPGQPENPREITSNSLLNRYLSSRGFTRGQFLEPDSSPEPEPEPESTRLGQPEPARSMEDRDSVSSIAAVIQSESLTVDTAAEIDSRVVLSTSSSRRRSESSSRVSDVDSGDSRAPRRRRLQ